MNSVTIRRPDDMHLHLRDGNMMRAVLPYTASVFGRALVMPNLAPPVTTVDIAQIYRSCIHEALPPKLRFRFEPLMTLYLTDKTSAGDVDVAYADGGIPAFKLYPAHATTNSAHGVTDIEKVMPVLEKMATLGMPLCVHGEMLHRNGEEIDIFDREHAFIDHVLIPLRKRLPELKIVLEHITTKEAADYVSAAYLSPRFGTRTAATITPHHLVINRNDIFRGGLRPHLYCLPIAKREGHRLALRRAATSGLPCFFLGTDSAPHPTHAKESACGCAGIFCAPVALQTYAQVFEEEGALDKLEAFASLNGAYFYGLEPNEERITLMRDDHNVVHDLDYVYKNYVVPFRASETLRWSIAK